MSRLRDDIRQYEAETGKKVKCFGVVRSLYCPMSALGCPMARLFMKQRGASAAA
jgi:hypothetical protein